MSNSLVASINYTTKQIFLSINTINKDLDTILVYREIELLRSTTPAHQLFSPLIFLGGNEEIIPNVSFTEPYVKLAAGVRIIPYNTPHSLRLITRTFSTDGLKGRSCFDRSSLTSIVDIDVEISDYKLLTPDMSMMSLSVWSTNTSTLTDNNTIGGKLNSKVDTIIGNINNIPSAVRTELTTELTHLSTLQNGQGLDSTQAIMLLEIYKLYGLDPLKPLIVTTTSRSIGTDIVQSIDSDTTRTIITRT